MRRNKEYAILRDSKCSEEKEGGKQMKRGRGKIGEEGRERSEEGDKVRQEGT